jgi:phage regulator Rha-like protein
LFAEREKSNFEKTKMKKEISIPQEIIQQKIYLIRGEKVMFDRDLAELYDVETRILNQAVKRNKDRFPSDFMFQLTKQEMEIWISQFVISNENLKSQNVISSWGGRRKPSLVFTEQGVAMLSSVLNSKRAVQVNIQIIRTFTILRKILATHKELREKIDAMEQKYDKRFRVIFDTLRLLIKEDKKPKKRIGFYDRKL